MPLRARLPAARPRTLLTLPGSRLTPRRPEQQAEVDQLFLSRLAVPHLSKSWPPPVPLPIPSVVLTSRFLTDHEATFAAYSHFITKHDNDNYGTKLPAANKAYAPVKAVVDEREEEEAKLVRTLPRP